MNNEIIKAIQEMGGSAVMDDILKHTGMLRETLNRQIRVMCKRGEIKRTFVEMGKYRGSAIGLMTKYGFVYSLN